MSFLLRFLPVLFTHSLNEIKSVDEVCFELFRPIQLEKRFMVFWLSFLTMNALLVSLEASKLYDERLKGVYSKL